MKNQLFVFSLLVVLSAHVLASDVIVPEDNSDTGTNTDITIESVSGTDVTIESDTGTDVTIESDTSSEDLQINTNANTDEQVVDYDEALKKMDEEMMIKE